MISEVTAARKCGTRAEFWRRSRNELSQGSLWEEERGCSEEKGQWAFQMTTKRKTGYVT